MGSTGTLLPTVHKHTVYESNVNKRLYSKGRTSYTPRCKQTELTIIITHNQYISRCQWPLLISLRVNVGLIQCPHSQH